MNGCHLLIGYTNHYLQLPDAHNCYKKRTRVRDHRNWANTLFEGPFTTPLTPGDICMQN